LRVILVAEGGERNLIGSCWHTGARKGEALRWWWSEDINFEERWVRLGTKKSRDGSITYEKVWMNDDLYDLLMSQWKNRDPNSPYVFPTYCCLNRKGDNWKGEQRTHRLLKKLCERAGVDLSVSMTSATLLQNTSMTFGRWI
jgi:integrase